MISLPANTVKRILDAGLVGTVLLWVALLVLVFPLSIEAFFIAFVLGLLGATTFFAVIVYAVSQALNPPVAEDYEEANDHRPPAQTSALRGAEK